MSIEEPKNANQEDNQPVESGTSDSGFITAIVAVLTIGAILFMVFSM